MKFVLKGAAQSNLRLAEKEVEIESIIDPLFNRFVVSIRPLHNLKSVSSIFEKFNAFIAWALKSV